MGYIKIFLQVYDKQKSLETLLWTKNLFGRIVSIFCIHPMIYFGINRFVNVTQTYKFDNF